MKKYLQLFILGVTIATNAQNPIYHFTFNNTLVDDSNTNTFVINTGVSSAATPTYYAGVYGNALAISGTYNVQVSLPNLPQGNAPRTIMMWVNSGPINSVENPLWNYGTASNLQGLGLKHDFNGGSRLTTYAVGASNQVTTTNSGIGTNDYYLLTVTYDGTTLKTYKNSTLLNSININLNTTGNLLQLGRFLGEASTYNSVFAKVDDLKIYDTALTQNQIVNQYTNGADFSNGLLAFYDFENNFDSSTGNYNLTSSGTTNFGSGVDGTGHKSANFGGSNLLFNTSLDAAFNNQEFTISFWELRSATTSPYDTSYEAFGSNYLRLRQNTIRVNAAYNSTNYFTEIDFSPNPNFDGIWKHYAIVFKKLSSSTYIAVYEDGVLRQTTSISSAVNLHKFNNKFTIGGGTDTSGNFLSSKYAHANIDKFFIYNRMLNATEINAIKDLHQEVFNLTLSSNDFNQNNLKVAIYPNPVNDILNIDIENEIKSVEIYNIQGQKVMQSNAKQIETSSLNTGIYMVRIEDVNGGIAIQKLIKK